jgi:hypothetical protein
MARTATRYVTATDAPGIISGTICCTNDSCEQAPHRTVVCMHCPLCGRVVVENQKFCADCGHSIAGLTDLTEVLRVISPPADPTDVSSAPHDSQPGAILDKLAALLDNELPNDELPDIAVLATQEISERPPIPDPGWGTPTGDVPFTPTASNLAPLPTTGEVPTVITAAEPPVDVLATTQIPAQRDTAGNAAVPGHITAEIPELFDNPDNRYEYPQGRDPFKVKLIFILAFFGAIAVLMTAIADIIDIRTSTPVDGIATGVRTLDTLGTNLAVAGFVGATVMALGGLLACFGFRWGAGLAGGAGLALAGWAALVVGLAELRIASAESITRQTTDLAFTLKVTRDLGFWLVVAVATIGLLVFLASLRSIGTGGRLPLNPWIAALGAVAGVVLVAGPLIPENTATFVNNYRSANPILDLPALYFAGRLVQLALIGVAIVFGMLIVRAYGLGLAAGGVSVALWMWVSSLFDMGTFPLGIAAGNFGSDPTDPTPHAVTTAGMVLMLVMLAVGAVLAIVGHQRHQRHQRRLRRY